MRNYLIIKPPGDFVHALDTIRFELKEFKNEIVFLEPHHYHIQIHFIGESIPLEDYKRMLQSVRSELGQIFPFLVQLEDIILGLPNQRNPKLLHIPIESSNEIDWLQKRVIHSLSPIPSSFINTRRSRLIRYPHLKVGIVKPRVSRSVAKRIKDTLERVSKSTPRSFEVHELLVMKTVLSGGKKKITFADSVSFGKKNKK